MWEWITEKCKMPKFVWLGVLAFLLALSYKVVTAGHVLINLNERSLEVVKAERKVAAREKHLLEVSDEAIEHLEKAKKEAPPEVRPKIEIAQRTIREDIKRPVLDRKKMRAFEDWIEREKK